MEYTCKNRNICHSPALGIKLVVPAYCRVGMDDRNADHGYNQTPEKTKQKEIRSSGAGAKNL